MSQKMKWVANKMPKTDCSKELALMAPDEIKKVRAFHASFPQYEPTPLRELSHLGQKFDAGNIFIKDESFRFGLNAFKVLGGSFAMANFIAHQTGKDISELGYHELTSPQTKKELGDYTFFTATDGNHGRGVAWAANQIGQSSVVYMPKGSSQTRLENIRKEGADASIKEGNYDDCVRMAYADSLKKPNSVIVQDTAWEGYEEIPSWIMQGYGTMALEALQQLQATGADRPTHIFVQAGVGSMAGAIVGYFSNVFADAPPKMTVVEASAADCLYRSAELGDGTLLNVTGDLSTIMAGLACGEGSTISWEILKNKADFFVSLPDYDAARAMRVLAVPLKGDPTVISGESGAAGMGALLEIIENPEYEDFRKAQGIDENSVILLFSTEGNTDPDWFRKVVWDGYYAMPEDK